MSIMYRTLHCSISTISATLRVTKQGFYHVIKLQELGFSTMPSFGYKQCPSAERVDGKTVIITGANTGIGKETARELVSRGARVILACRDADRANEAAKEISLADQNRPDAATVKILDLGSMASIRNFTKDILETEPKVDILINNAGLMGAYQKTADGFEMHFGVNHLGTFLLTNLLLERIKESAPSRIITLSSGRHASAKINFDDLQSEKNFDAIDAYGQSKLANVLFTLELTKKLKGTGVSAYAVDPGVVRTEFKRNFGDLHGVKNWIFDKVGSIIATTPDKGAQTSIYCAVAKELQEQSGLYYSNCASTEPSARAKDEAAALKLWEISSSLVHI